MEKTSAKTPKTRKTARVLDKLAPPIDSELAAEMYCDEILDGAGRYLHLDRVRSVSGLVLVRDITPIPEIIRAKRGPHYG